MRRFDPDGSAVRVRAVMQTAIARRRVVGAHVLASLNGVVIVDEVAGLRDLERDEPMPASPLFRLASLTKPVTSAVALGLAREGRLDLDAPISALLPGFQPALPDCTVPVITSRQLMLHTAGLSYGFSFPHDDNPYARAGVSDGLAEPGVSLRDNLARLASVPLLFAPGTGWQYSLSLDVLGGVLEAATGQTLDALVRERIGAPLGWTRSGFAPGEGDDMGPAYVDGPVRMGARHVLKSPLGGGTYGEVVFAPDRALDPASYPSGGAGMVGDAREYLAFLEMLRVGGGDVLDPQDAAVFGVNATGTLSTTPGREGLGFGIGASVLNDPDAARAPLSPGSFSWGGAYGHSWFVDRALGLSVVMLSNTTFAGMTGPYPDAVRDAFFVD
ncbi:beta-lactamase family protein [Ameyamaea chiangmaiensis]|uniref:Beta-lactamase family protein n=2 Tax=Ameyamaea chiangmaiensis TaxID=442969 RepID=A0A850PBV1_9PROT|nr:beta-lactamase family protein [Ameyamaea chiangmaiensis]NVN40149.1 beta-lactamase family protein [Ameyamaea chiangmaiensis]